MKRRVIAWPLACVALLLFASWRKLSWKRSFAAKALVLPNMELSRTGRRSGLLLSLGWPTAQLEGKKELHSMSGI